MTATEDFLKKKMAGQTTGSTSGGSATDQFFKKKIAEKSAVTADTNIATPPENPTTPGDLGIKLGEPVRPLISSIQEPSKPDTAYSGQGTTSMGQGVKIDQSAYKLETQKAQAKSDEDLRIKQEDLVMGAQQLGHLFVDKLSPQDKEILISGLKNKSASLAYKGQADKMSELVGESISPTLTQAGPNDTIDPSLSPDPRNPDNFAFYEKQKRNFDMVAPDGTKIKAYNKTAVDDPVENVNVALNMGRDQVMGTIGAIGEWMGVSDGTFRKQAENQQKWDELDFNKPLDDTNASVFDSRFWTQKVPQSIPFMVALVPAGLAGAAVGGETAAIAGLGELGTYLTTAGFAGISSRIAESITEGAGVYADLKDKGATDTTASKEAFDTAKQNMWMVFSDMGQMAATFAPVKKIPGLQNLLGKVLIPTAKFAFDATSEGGEEVFQGYVQQLNTAQGLGKKPLSILEYLNSDEARETFKLGAATGLMFGGVGVAKDAYDNFIDRATSQVDMVNEAIQKNDIDFVPKMEVLAKKGAVSEQTVEAVKTLLDMNLKNEGSSYDEWMTNGLQARKEKIDETRGKIQDLNNAMKEEVKPQEKTFEENLTQAVSEGKISERQKGYIKNEEDLKTAIENGNKVEELTGSRSITREIVQTPEEKKTGAMIASIESQNIGLENDINNSKSKDVVEAAKIKLEENKIKLEELETKRKGIKTKVEQAIEIGKQNAIDGKSHAPAQSKELMDLIKDIPVGGSKEIMQGFVDGYNDNIPETNWKELGIPEQKKPVDEELVQKYRGDIRSLVDHLGERFFEKDGKVWKKPIRGEAEVGNDTVNSEEFKRALTAEGELYKNEKPMDLTKGPEVMSIPEKQDSWIDMDNNKSDGVMEYSKTIDKRKGETIGGYTINSEVWYSSEGGYFVKAEKDGKNKTVQVSEIYASEYKKPTEIKMPIATVQKTEIKDISEKGMAVVGYTMHIKDILKEAGGKWNPKYKGWIFSKKRRAEIQSIIDENPSEVSKEPVVEKTTPTSKASKKNEGIISKPDANFTLYTKIEGESTYKLTNLKGNQVEGKVYAPIIQPEKFKEFVDAVRITAGENPKTAFQIRQFNSKILYDSTKDETLEIGQKTTKEDNIQNITTNPTQNDNINTRQVSSEGDRTSQEGANKEGAMGGGDTSDSKSGDGSGGETPTSNGGKRLGKKGRAEINEKAKAILESKKYSTDRGEYTQEDIQVLEEYSGAGGKEDAGATGRGLLDEYYTPKKIVDAMWSIAEFVNPRGKSVLEPTAGVGRFIQGRTEKYEISGMEIDKVSGTIAQILNPDAKISIGDFQKLFIEDNGKQKKPTEKYDIIIGNPPYGARAGLLKGLGEEKKISRQEEYFMKRGVDLLNDQGALVFIVPSSFLNNGRSFAKEQIVANGGELVAAYRLPEGMFEDTTIGTDIVVIKKTGNGHVGNMIDGTYFTDNPENILGTVETRKNKYGRIEEFISGDKEEAIKRIEKIGKDFITKKVDSNIGSFQEEFDQVFNTKTQQVEKKTTEKAVVEKKQKEPRKTEKPREVVSDIGGVPTIEKQILNDWSATQEELDIFANTKQDGSVPFKEEWAEYLNLYKGEYFHDINYFSGDVREKLDQLELEKKQISDEQYNLQRAGLERVLPKDKTVQDISFDPLDRFIAEFPTGKEKTVWVTKNGRREWEYVPELVKDLFFKYVQEIPRGLLRNEVQKGDIINYVNGDRARSDTKRIMGYIKSESKRLFNEFIKTTLDFELQTKIAEKYNKEKNAYVRPRYDRIPVSIEGMAEEFRGKKFHLSETQKTGVGFLVNKGSGLIAYGVGVGKTHTLAVATMANMQKGWAKRPLFIVPGSTLEKTWIKTIEGTFPGVKINNLGGLQAPIVRQLQKERGEDFSTWIKDGEISIITHDGILKLGFKPEELFELTRDLNDALGNFDSNLTEREREKDREKIQEELGKALRGQSEVSFTDLGFDHISVDEVHNFRKVFQGAKTEVGENGEKKGGGKRFANVIGGQPSTRARKLFLLSQAVQKKSGGRNVFLASATPFENHATEVYNILSFMARSRLKQMGIFNINDFFSAYANFQTEIIQKADGTFENKEVMKSFSNLQELQRLIQEFIDFKEDPTLVRPDKVVLTPQLKMSPKQAEVKQKILEMLASDDDGVVLKATTYAKSNSTSPFFVKEFMSAPTSLDDFIENSPKIKYTLEMIKELKSNPKTASKGSFIYIGKEGVNFTDYYVKYLTERVGYKSSEIGVITGEISIDDREAIKDKFNNGTIKVLIGGDPTKEGIDLQDNGYATFNVALGWNPTEMAQVEGRVWRQGNRANKVLMVYPLVENSGDVNIYQKFEEKAGRINDLFSYSEGKTIFDVGEVDPKEKKLMLLTDPAQKANLSIIIDSEKINSDLIYNRGTLEDMKKMKSEFTANETAITDITKKIEYTTDEVFKKELKDKLKTFKTKNDGITKKLAAKDIKDFDSEIARIEKNVESLTEDLAKTKLTFEELLTKFTNEEVENTKNTKSIDTHRGDIKAEIEKLYFKSEEELKAEKESKIAEADIALEAKRKFQDETSDSWIYDIVGAKYGVKAFAKEKIDLKDVYLEAVRLAPGGWNVRVEDPSTNNYLENVVAYADLATKEIVISATEARKSTAAHEVVHASLSELPEDQRKIIIETARKQWEAETQRKLTDEQSEEFLAEEFKYYIESQKWKTKTLFGRIKEYLSKLWNTIKGVFGKDNKIKTFYEDILAGNIVNTQTRVGKKFQSLSDKELYDQIDAENFGYKLPPKLGLAYQKYEKEKVPSKELTSLKEFGRRTFTPLDTTIRNISEKLSQRLAKFEYGVMNSPIVQEARPVMQRLFEKIKDKKQTDEYRILDIALKNGDAEVVNHYAELLGIVPELKEARSILDAIYRESADVGIDMKYLEEYFPRTVNDSIGLLSYMYGTEYGSQIKEAIKLSEIQVGHDLSDEEKAVIANKMLRGYKIAGVTLTPPGNVKARSIEEVTKELNPFYNDSMDSLAIYIQGMNENIEARKLFGKGENLDNSIGAFTMQLLADGEITPVQEIQLTKAIQARFANNPMDAWVQAYRGISYLTTMGSVVSALTQIQDLSFSLYENGFMRSGTSWIQALAGKSKISTNDLGVHSIIQEFKEKSKIQDAVTKVFKMVGLEFMDKLGKETFVNAYYKTLQNEVRQGNLSGLDALGDTKLQAAQDLIDGKVTEDIKYILFARLCDFQPLTRSQMPEYYNTSGNMKVVYMLKTYTIKQIDVFRREAFHEIYQGSKMGGDKARVVKGIKNLIFLVTSLALMGAGTDILKNLLLNRPFSLTDLVIDNILKIMGFSKYTIYKVKEDSLSAGLLSLVIPPFNFFNDVITDIGDAVDGKLDNPMNSQSVNNIPVAGKLYYWWFGKGAIKSEKKREKAAKAGMPKVSTKKVSPFSETNGFKTQNGFKDKLYFK